ncbi:hypothetical protein ACWDOP_26850 [Nocardia sp. NPDC003693]
MKTITRAATLAAATIATAGTALAFGTGVASADEWPEWNPNSPISVFETKDFLTPADPGYWNPFESRARLTSPFGTSTRIVCTAFHGQMSSCFQADGQGNPHKLGVVPNNFPFALGSSTQLTGGQHFIYPGFIPGS